MNHKSYSVSEALIKLHFAAPANTGPGAHPDNVVIRPYVHGFVLQRLVSRTQERKLGVNDSWLKAEGAEVSHHGVHE